VSRWWNEATAEDQARMQALYASGQLDFANGGWCMHDEAAVRRGVVGVGVVVVVVVVVGGG
jgi:hypothetical protein